MNSSALKGTITRGRGRDLGFQLQRPAESRAAEFLKTISFYLFVSRLASNF
jgi:hypothetical protein